MRAMLLLRISCSLSAIGSHSGGTQVYYSHDVRARAVFLQTAVPKNDLMLAGWAARLGLRLDVSSSFTQTGVRLLCMPLHAAQSCRQ